MSNLGGENVSSTQSLTLDLPPSCIEFCPSHPEYFVVGTYSLEKSEDAEPPPEKGEEGDHEGDSSLSGGAKLPQSRSGSIILFHLRDGKVHLVETISQPSAVFDLHFSPLQDQGDICAAVSSTGTISFFKLLVSGADIPPTPDTPTGPSARLQSLSTLAISELIQEELLTYFAWHPIIRGLIAITTASGKVILVQIQADYQGLRIVQNPVIEHDLEAWVVAFSPPRYQFPSSRPTVLSGPVLDNDPFTIFSGGDDCALKYATYKYTRFDIDPSRTTDPPATVTVPSRRHSAGVTAILPLNLPVPKTDLSSTSPSAWRRRNVNLLLSGSYDDHFRIFRIMRDHASEDGGYTKLLAETNLGGGVWRLNVIGGPVSAITAGDSGRYKWVMYVLASCMHAGTRVLRLTGENSKHNEAVEVDVVARFEEHKSMNYGSDWSRVESWLGNASAEEEGARRKVVCVSTSFYDRLLCVWEASLPI